MLVITKIGGNCPVQAEGTFDDKPFYFRARGQKWSIGVGGDTVGNPDWRYIEQYVYGDNLFAAGWMTKNEANAFIQKAYRLWSKRAKKYPNIYKCEFDSTDGERLRVKMLQDHKKLGGRKGEYTITSRIVWQDFSKGIAVTKNSVYIWKV